MIKLDDYYYFLPKELIAQHAVVPKDHSRLMVVSKGKISNRESDVILHKHFYDLIDFLKSGDVLVVNETKVKKARICGQKVSGAKFELILLKQVGDCDYECTINSNAKMVGCRCVLPTSSGDIFFEIIDKKDNVYKIIFDEPLTDSQLKHFELPTPPYVTEKLNCDSEYQTVYSNSLKEKSFAAPTAGLHFTDKLLNKIEKKEIMIVKICLNVGFGTFLPIPVEKPVEEHTLHTEEYEVSQSAADLINNRKGRLIIVGTTTLRTLESSCDDSGKIHSGCGSTNIFIYPPYKFKLKFDGLITNFHLPKSSLLLLVSAYFGRENILGAYNLAVSEGYRFYSLGDAMLLVK